MIKNSISLKAKNKQYSKRRKYISSGSNANLYA